MMATAINYLWYLKYENKINDKIIIKIFVWIFDIFLCIFKHHPLESIINREANIINTRRDDYCKQIINYL